MRRNEKSVSGKEKGVIICISGMAGTGKSTLAKKLAKKYGLKYYSGGDALKELAAEQGYDSGRNGWWESPEGLGFLAKREKDPSFDKAVDAKLLEHAAKGNVVLDGWTMPWLVKEGFKIWLAASEESRAERISRRDKITYDEAMKALREKEARTKTIYKSLYGFALGEDLAPFDFILDTDNLSSREVFQVLCNVVDNVVLRGCKP